MVSFERHLGKLKDETAEVQAIWQNLREVYQGRGADTFAEALSRTRQMTDAYMEVGDVLLPRIRNRIEDLRRFDSVTGLRE